MAGPSNNAEIEEFVVFYNTSFDNAGDYHEAKSVGKDVDQTEIRLSPWVNYTFHVRARNELGLSPLSDFSKVCSTKAARPENHPKNVCTESREPNQLVIVWDVSFYGSNTALFG